MARGREGGREGKREGGREIEGEIDIDIYIERECQRVRQDERGYVSKCIIIIGRFTSSSWLTT